MLEGQAEPRQIIRTHRIRRRWCRLPKGFPKAALVFGVAMLGISGDATGQSHVVGWGDQVVNSAWTQEPFAEIAAGYSRTLARRSDGSVVAWGSNQYAQCNAPLPQPGASYVEIAAGWYHTLSRLSDGSGVAWGVKGAGQGTVSNPPPGISYLEFSAGSAHSMARRSDGLVIAWGDNYYGQSNVPTLPAGLSYVEIAAGGTLYGLGYTQSHSVARRSDGSVVAWGDNTYGQSAVPPLQPGVSYVQIAAGGFHTLARRSDGSVAAWGDPYYGQTMVPALPPGLSYVEVAAGLYHSLARRSDGSVVAFGNNKVGQCNVPALPAGISYVAIAAGVGHSLGLRSDGSVVVWGDNKYGQVNVPTLPPGFVYVGIAAGARRSLARVEPAPACASPAIYCTAKVNSLGCTPAMAFAGIPSASAGSGFVVSTMNELDNMSGLYFYSTSGPNGAPFQGGFLCAQQPLARTPLQDSGGTLPCRGMYSIDFNAFVASGKDPSLVAGSQVWIQTWSRDPASPSGANLSEALTFSICP